MAKTKKPVKDHICSHDRKNPTGMEVCRACGDFGICPQCGDEYIIIDTGPMCYPCVRLERAHRLLRDEKEELVQRRESNGWKPAETAAIDE